MTCARSFGAPNRVARCGEDAEARKSRCRIYPDYVFKDRSLDQRAPGTRMQARTKILSGCLVVIEMAFAAVYSDAHAARRRQKGFDVAANFPEEKRRREER